MEAMPVRMSAEGFDAFMQAVSSPAQAVPEMVQVLRRPAPWEQQDEPARGE